MKICYVTHTFISEDNYGGVARYIFEICKELIERGYEVHVVCKSDSDKSYMYKGIVVHTFSNFKFSNILPKFLQYLSTDFNAYRRLKQLDKFYDYDIIEIEEIEGLGLLPVFDSELSVVTRLHGSSSMVTELNNSKGLTLPIIKAIERMQIEYSEYLTANSYSMQEIAIEYYDLDREIDKVIYCGIDFERLRSYIGNSSREENYILYFGKLEERKGIISLIEVFKRITSEIDINLYLAGGLPDYSAGSFLYSVLDNFDDFEERVKFFGKVDRNVLINLIKGSEMVALPSKWEPFGYTCLESLALGSLVVANDKGGFREMINDGENGYLLDYENYEEASEKILEILENKSSLKRIKERAVDSVELFSIDRVADELINFYRSLD